MTKKNILLDSNSFDFLFEHIEEIENIKNNYNFYYIYAQESEINKIPDLTKRLNLIKIKDKYTRETAGVFMVNAPCINRECYFVNSELLNKIEFTLKKYHCKKNNREENFINDLNLVISAYQNKYIILTNDGYNKNRGLLPALQELGIHSLSHQDFINIIF